MVLHSVFFRGEPNESDLHLKNKELILRMNGLLNDLIAKEVGVNDGRFLAPLLAPK